MLEKKYEFFEHTADVGLYIYGLDMAGLFCAAVEALTAQFTDPEAIKPSAERLIELEAANYEVLLRSWLAELLYLFHADGWLTREVEFSALSDNVLRAIARGESLDEERHEITREVKAVTWHRLRIERLELEGVLRATVVLDV